MSEQNDILDFEGPASGLVVITGGSRGIGASIAEAVAARGNPILVNYAGGVEAANGLARRITDSGGQIRLIQADVGTEVGVKKIFSEVDRLGIPLASLINNAGITGGFSRLDNVTDATLRRVFDVNVTGCFLCCREAVIRLSTRHGGHGGTIVNVSSIASKLGGSGEWVHYAASKGAVDTLTIGLAREVATEVIRVNAVAPGLIDTELHAAAGDAGRLLRLASRIPMGRAGTANEVANAVLWLMSRSARYVTGIILPVGGGR